MCFFQDLGFNVINEASSVDCHQRNLMLKQVQRWDVRFPEQPERFHPIYPALKACPKMLLFRVIP
jgi:hypothetical protein